MENKIAVKLVKCVSEKSKKEYFKLFADFGYRQQNITFDSALIIALLDCPMSTLYDVCKNVDDEQIVAFLDFNLD